MLRDILSSCVLVDISDVMNCATDCIQKSCAAPNGIVISGHGFDTLDAYAVMNNLAGVVEEDGGDQGFALCVLLLFNHRVKAANGVSFKPTHRAAAVKDKDDFG